MDHLSDDQVRYLTEVDYDDHMAWVALDATRSGHPGVGVARYVRLPDEPSVAEAAVTVLDDYQGKGIGTILLRLLAESALAHGIRSFRGYVLAANDPMVAVLRDLGAAVARQGRCCPSTSRSRPARTSCPTRRPAGCSSRSPSSSFPPSACAIWAPTLRYHDADLGEWPLLPRRRRGAAGWAAGCKAASWPPPQSHGTVERRTGAARAGIDRVLGTAGGLAR